MPLANRVDPFGALFATTERGRLMGNRGGRFHCADTQTNHARPWVSRQWICCKLSFKGRHRSVWGKGYTELFFSDEFAALAAGHRPCFECRREDALHFAAAWGRATGTPPPNASTMDQVLDQERLEADPTRAGKRRRRLHSIKSCDLPDGAMIAVDGAAYLIKDSGMKRWSFNGYSGAQTRPMGLVKVLTPPSVLACLHAGYLASIPSPEL